MEMESEPMGLFLYAIRSPIPEYSTVKVHAITQLNCPDHSDIVEKYD
jgi:hypothetical protein